MSDIVQSQKSTSSFAKGAQTLAGAALGAAGSWILYSNLGIDHHLPLPNAIPADHRIFFSEQAGKLSYYVDESASGRPLVLIHSVNAAASAYEMRPLFEHFRLHRPVFALDLPGYGFSERSSRDYTPDTFAEAIIDLLITQVGEPADVVALSLGCEFAARAAFYEPDRFRSLALISPTGFSQGADSMRATQRAGTRGGSQSFFNLVSFSLWRRPFFDLIVTRRSIEFFLQQSFNGAIPAGFVDYAYVTSHQPGAEYVPLHFISGLLFTQNAYDRLYANLSVSCLVIYDHDAFTSFERLPGLVASNDNWQSVRISPTSGLPHFEKTTETAQAMEDFWAKLP
jgi:pimeloyl-ACP methyl ester carboxylesterase